MPSPTSVCAFTSICEEDRVWIPQYLAEAERLRMPFVVHLDRCKPETAGLFKRHDLLVGVTSQDDPKIEFTEQHKQAPLDLVAQKKFGWAMAWDIDETYEFSAREKIDRIAAMSVDLVDIIWLNLWNDKAHVRVDGSFMSGHRVKFLNLNSGKWTFDSPITNGPKLPGAMIGKSDLVCLHHGMMTHELREQHKARWDRIYTAAVGANPYGFWNYALDPTIQPQVQRHGYYEHE